MRGFTFKTGAVVGIAMLGAAWAARPASEIQLAKTSLAAEGSPAAARSAKDWVQVSDDPEKGELTFLIGPIPLEANTSHHAVKNPPLVTVTVPTEGYVYGFEVQMQDGHGNPMTNAVLHHVNLIDPDHRELFSPVPRRLFAAGSETRNAGMPKFLGVPLEEGQKLIIVSMYHNPTPEHYPDAHLRVTLKYRSEGWFFPIAVAPVYIDVMGHVGEKDFDLPPGVYERSWEGIPAISGRLLGAGGHLHAYSKTLRFEDVTSGKVLWEVGPVLDEEGQLITVPIGKFWWKGGLPIVKGHTYRFTVIYDNPTGETLVGGGMGVLGGIFKPARGEEWPALNEEDPMYLANMEEIRVAAERRELGMPAGGEEHDQGTHAH